MAEEPDRSAVAAAEAPPTPPAVPDTVDFNGSEREESKLKLVLSVLKRFIGVKDMASARMSLPSQLLEPIGNLEYWNYNDRPDYFVTMSDPEDPLDRMVAVLRWWFTKDLKHVKGGLVKPYNSILGEFFRCRWQVREPVFRPDGTIDPSSAELSFLTSDPPKSGASSVNSVSASVPASAPASGASTPAAGKAARRPLFGRLASKAASAADKNNAAAQEPYMGLLVPQRDEGAADDPDQAVDENADSRPVVPVAFLCEQTSHHPAVSAYTYYCPQKGIRVRGMDQIQARFTGTSIRVTAGDQNKGIFVDLLNHGEEYGCSHPVASAGGFLRGHLTLHVHESTWITCPQTKLKALMAYPEERWLGKPKFAVEGVIYKYDPESDTITDPRKVPEDKVLVRVQGSWREKLTFTRTAACGDQATEPQTLVDLIELSLVDKEVPPHTEQDDYESRRVWDAVTQAIKRKHYSKATAEKVAIEDRQRAASHAREKEKQAWVSRFFIPDTENGRPELTEAGRITLERLLQGDFSLPAVARS